MARGLEIRKMSNIGKAVLYRQRHTLHDNLSNIGRVTMVSEESYTDRPLVTVVYVAGFVER